MSRMGGWWNTSRSAINRSLRTRLGEVDQVGCGLGWNHVMLFHRTSQAWRETSGVLRGEPSALKKVTSF